MLYSLFSFAHRHTLLVSHTVFTWGPSSKWAASWESQRFAYAKTNLGTDQLHAKLISAFVFAVRIVQSLYFLNTKFKPLAISSSCTALFMWDLVRIHIVGFPTMRLKGCLSMIFSKCSFSIYLQTCKSTCIDCLSHKWIIDDFRLESEWHVCHLYSLSFIYLKFYERNLNLAISKYMYNKRQR